MDLLNVPDAERLDGAKVALPALASDLSQRVNRIVGAVRAQRPGAMPLYTVRQGGAAESKVLSLMCICVYRCVYMNAHTHTHTLCVYI